MEDITTTTPTPTDPVNKGGGSHMLTTLVIVLAVVTIAALGWWTFNNAPPTTDADQTTKQPSIPEVNTDNDLAAAETFLSDSEIDAQLNTSEIDSILNQRRDHLIEEIAKRRFFQFRV